MEPPRLSALVVFKQQKGGCNAHYEAVTGKENLLLRTTDSRRITNQWQSGITSMFPFHGRTNQQAITHEPRPPLHGAPKLDCFEEMPSLLSLTAIWLSVMRFLHPAPRTDLQMKTSPTSITLGEVIMCNYDIGRD